jgi:hypothetical protein
MPLVCAPIALVAGVLPGAGHRLFRRKVDRLVEQLGVAGMSKDQASRMCRGLDEQVGAFRERPPEGRHPYLWFDAKVERVRERTSGHLALTSAPSRKTLAAMKTKTRKAMTAPIDPYTASNPPTFSR